MRDYGQESENFQGRMFHMMDTYDAANRLTSVGGVAYTWDANGNLTNDGVLSYTYDHANRLSQVTEGSLTTLFAYNGDGVRTSKTSAGETTEYALDLLATLPVVISDTDAVYLYGLDIIAQQQTERLYYFHDGLGSVRQLVDTTGHVETNYAYDPFGVPVAEGDGSNPYQYTGEAWDAEVELLYLRARYYQPEVGRFITKDPWEGDLRQPTTLNRYVYARDNPINLTDPAGLQTWCLGSCQPQIVNPDPELRRWADHLLAWFSIQVGQEYIAPTLSHEEVPQLSYILWSNWSDEQLRLVNQAADDFAVHMQGYTTDFRSKVGPLPLYKREGALEIPFMGGVGGFTGLRSVTLPGTGWSDEGGAMMKGTIVHEMAHIWDLHAGWGAVSREMASGFWTAKLAECQFPPYAVEAWHPIVSDWRPGRERQWLNPAEDWADSVVAYVYPAYVSGAGKKGEISESRWYFVASRMNPGNPERYEYPPQWRSIEFPDTLLREIDPTKK
jgi:RHS repeat-associated protein